MIKLPAAPGICDCIVARFDAFAIAGRLISVHSSSLRRDPNMIFDEVCIRSMWSTVYGSTPEGRIYLLSLVRSYEVMFCVSSSRRGHSALKSVNVIAMTIGKPA